MTAIAVFKGKIFGKVLFIQEERCRVVVQLDGVPPGLHGIHVHQFGDTRQGCKSMGPHFSVQKSDHGGRNTRIRHSGDLGNVRADQDGLVRATFKVDLDVQDIWGRGLVLHADPDDLGRGSFQDSKLTGHSGDRIACAIIARSK